MTKNTPAPEAVTPTESDESPASDEGSSPSGDQQSFDKALANRLARERSKWEKERPQIEKAAVDKFRQKWGLSEDKLHELGVSAYSDLFKMIESQRQEIEGYRDREQKTRADRLESLLQSHLDNAKVLDDARELALADLSKRFDLSEDGNELVLLDGDADQNSDSFIRDYFDRRPFLLRPRGTRGAGSMIREPGKSVQQPKGEQDCLGLGLTDPSDAQKRDVWLKYTKRT